MPRLAWNNFRTQMTVIAAASVAVSALAAALVREVITSTERALTQEAQQQCSAAAQELSRQYQDRLSYDAEWLGQLPPEAQDLSLRGLAQTVLRSYDGVEGGFYRPDSRRVMGHAAVHPSRSADLELIEEAARRGFAPTAPSSASVVAAAAHADPQTVAWAAKKLSAAAGPALARRRWWLAALVLSALAGVGAVVWISILLRRGVTGINSGLQRMGTDYSFRFRPIPGDLGEIVKAVNLMADRRAALEAELRRQDRLAALGTAVAGVAHEIRNPLNSIRLTLELLDRRVRRGAATSEEVAAAIREVERLDGILTRLLAFGRPVPAERRPQPLRALIEEAVRMVHNVCLEKAVRMEVGASDSWVEVDGPQMEQVFLNLLLNAAEASPRGGVVWIRSLEKGNRVEVAVRDSGPGIAECARDHVFDAYFTTKPQGNGLGLAVSREIVMNHGGELEFDSSDSGTTFFVRLPAARTRHEAETLDTGR